MPRRSVQIGRGLVRCQCTVAWAQTDGAVGPLALAHRRGLLPDLPATIDSLLRQGFRLSEDLVARVLREAQDTRATTEG